MTAFKLPDLGEGLQEAEIVAWHINEGDHVVVDQPLLSVETEKAVVEIPSPKSGHIARLLAKVGQRIPVGAPLLEFEEGQHAETGTVVGSLEPTAPAAPIPAAPRQAPAHGAPPATPAAPAATPKGRAAPAVRQRAHKLGIDLGQVTATGPNGAVTLADLERAIAAPAPGSQPLRGARRSMATNMARAGREVVPATLQDFADIDAWTENAEVTARLIRAVVSGCTAEPALNSSFDAATVALRPNSQIDLGLAIDSPDGLFVPVLRDVAAGGPESWRSQVEAAKKGVRERSLTPAELREPTITLSNFGTLAGQHAALVVVPPQVAIIGAGRIREQAARSGSGIAMHRMLPLSLTFDHRAVTGGEAARFLRAVIADLEKPA